MWAAMSMTRLCGCAGSSEPSLAICAKGNISWADSVRKAWCRSMQKSIYVLVCASVRTCDDPLESLNVFNLLPHNTVSWACQDPESFARWGPLLIFFSFLAWWVMRRGKSQIPLLVGHQRPASETPLKWWPNIDRWIGSCDLSGDPDQYC